MKRNRAVAALLVALVTVGLVRAADTPANPLANHWSLLKEGEGQGTVEQNAAATGRRSSYPTFAYQE